MRLACVQRRLQHVEVSAEQRRRQIVQLQKVRARQRDRALDDALELADVARPLVHHERIDGRRRQLQRAHEAMAFEKVLRELDDVVASRAERRHLHVDAVEAVVEVHAEPAVLDEARQRPVGRDDDPRVDAARAVAAYTLDREILNGAQQLRLRGRRQIRDLVEKERAVVRVFELAAPAPHARGRPLLDAEQLRLEQGLDDRCAIDRDERPLAGAD